MGAPQASDHGGCSVGRVALVHDYLTQRGGAERVVLSMVKAFPGAPLYTSLYDPDGTFPEFAAVDVRVLAIDRLRALRHDHRRALPLLAPAFASLRVTAEVVLCSSSGWAHGVRSSGPKIVYCHNPARWLYQTSQYLQEAGPLRRAGLSLLKPTLVRRDKAAAASAARYLTNSSVVRRRIQAAYGREADILPPPPAITPRGPQRAVPGVEPGFLLAVSRLMPYKNLAAICAALERLPDERLVIAGSGPQAEALRRIAPPNVCLLGRVADDGLRWLYASCAALVTASYEDFGLTPLEAASFGAPAVALRWGGFLDTVVEGETGVFFDRPTPDAIAAGIRRLRATTWRADVLRRHAERFSEERFVAALHEVVRASAGV